MKKSLSLVLAVIFALAAIFAVSTMVFADDPDTAAGTPAAEAPKAETPAAEAPKAETPAAEEKVVTRPVNDRDNTAKAADTTKAPESTSVNGLSQLESLVNRLDATTKTTIPNSVKDDDAPVVTNAPGQTAFVNDDTSAAANTTKAPAVVNTYVPKTGSAVAVPAIAVLALLAGTAAVVAVKKNDD